MSAREKAAVAIGVATLISGALWYLEPRTAADVDQHRQEQGVEELGDAHERVTDDQRRRGTEAGEANRREQLRPGEWRPQLDAPRLRWRW